MIKFIAGLFTILFLFSITTLAQIEPPKLRPVTPTEQQRNLIAEGVTLHDKRDYEGAIDKYKEVLKENEDCVEAMFELAYSYSAKGDHKMSLETAMKGAKYGSRLLAGFYETIGNALDSTGETKKAIEYYKAGVALSTKNTLLYFNIALAYRNLGDVNEYKSNLKRSVVSVPGHPSSQIALGEYYYKAGYKTPAILALARFMILEPRSGRSGTAYKEFQEMLGAGVSQGKDSNTINIIVNTNQKTDEGDFGSMDMILGLSRAGSLGEAGKGYKIAIETLNEGRIGIGAQMLGVARGAWEYASKYAQERKQFGKPIAEFQGIQFQIAQMATDIEAARLMVYNAARMKDAGVDFVKEAAMTKLFTSQVAERVTSLAVEIYGGYGFTKDYPVEKYWRDAKIGKIYEGTSNMQLATIAKMVMGK